MRRLKIILFVSLVTAWQVFAAVDVSVSGPATMERNSAYTVSLRLTASEAYQINVFEMRVTYDASVLEILSISSNVGDDMWESRQTKIVYDPTEDPASFYFLRGNTQGDAYALPAGTSLLCTLRVRVKDTAKKGVTGMGFIPHATFIGDVTGQRLGRDFTIILADMTAPVTSTNIINKNFYRTDVEASFWTNEEKHAATIYYELLRSEQVFLNGSGNDPLGQVQIQGKANEVVWVTVNYAAEDWAGDALGEPSHNREVTKSVSFLIDREYPTINAVVVDAPALVGPGNEIHIRFAVFDASAYLRQTQPIQVIVGGHTVEVSSLGCNHQYYDVPVTIRGNESNRDVLIRVTDRAGNTTVHTIQNALFYDFAAPDLNIVKVSPNVIYARQETLIFVTASEVLAAVPTVAVGVVAATYNYSVPSENMFVYSFIPTANGFNANFLWLAGTGGADHVPPFMTDIIPPPQATGRCVNQLNHFHLEDFSSDVDRDTLTVRINDMTAINNGILQPGYVGRITRLLPRSYEIYIAPEFGSFANSSVKIDIGVADTDPSQNVFSDTVTYSTAEGVDTTPPFVMTAIPASGNIAINPQDVRFHLSDVHTGVAIDSLSIQLWNVNRISGITYNYDTSVTTAVVINAVVNGLVQEGFSYSYQSDNQDGYWVTVTPNHGFIVGSKVNSVLRFSDLALQANWTAVTQSFIVASPGEGSNLNVQVPLAFPTVFDPGRENTRLYFPLKEKTDVTVVIYNISGVEMWKGSVAGREGANYIVWDGETNDRTFIENGVYLFYILGNNKKVLGRGKVVVYRAD